MVEQRKLFLAVGEIERRRKGESVSWPSLWVSVEEDIDAGG